MIKLRYAMSVRLTMLIAASTSNVKKNCLVAFVKVSISVQELALVAFPIWDYTSLTVKWYDRMRDFCCS